MAQQMVQYPAWPRALFGGESDGPIGWFLIACRLLLIVSMVAAMVFASSSMFGGSSAAFIGLALMIGAAGFAGGGLLGFLFGVPRMLGGAAILTGPAQVVSNSNVEQLSDWLTKMLVGVGLVEIHQVGPLLAGFRDQIDHALISSGGDPLPGAGFAACLILTGSTIAGFLAAYLKSRTDLMRAFREPLVAPSAKGDIYQRLTGDADTEQALATMLECLGAGNGHDAAIAIGERLAGDARAAKSGRPWLYLARAWGQRHAALMRLPSPHDEEAIAIARDHALAATRNALGTDREKNKAALRRSWTPEAPGQPSTDTDLESLHDDPAFADLLMPGIDA